MLSRVSRLVRTKASLPAAGRYLSAAVATTEERAPDYIKWPNEREGNEFGVNWSLTVDGITPVGDAYRNARIPLLASRLSSKIESSKVELKSPIYIGEYTMKEVGDSMTIDEFQEYRDKQVEYFESGIEMFVEDGGLGAHTDMRTPIRLVTDNAATALVFRSLFIPTPPRAVDHRARFNGWNADPRFIEPAMRWNGSAYEETPLAAAKGERPVVAVFGGQGATAAVQFVEGADKVMAGSNICIGAGAPVRAAIDSIGHAACVYINETNASVLALPSISLCKGADTCIVIGASDAPLNELAGSPSIYGAYHNLLSTSGVSAMWNGYIASASVPSNASPAIVVSGKHVVVTAPYNLVHAPKKIVFYEDKATEATLTEADAITKIVALTDESKRELAAELVKGAKLSVTGSIATIKALV